MCCVGLKKYDKDDFALQELFADFSEHSRADTKLSGTHGYAWYIT